MAGRQARAGRRAPDPGSAAPWRPRSWPRAPRVAALELDQAKAAKLAAELPGCVVSRGDATSATDARAAVAAAGAAFGGLDVLVNCVGIFDFYRGLADLDDEQLDAGFDEIFAVNVKSQLVRSVPRCPSCSAPAAASS